MATDPLGDIVLDIYSGSGKGQRLKIIIASARPTYTKAEVNYRPSPEDQGKDIPDECATCQYYHTQGGGMGECLLVVGDIHPEDICDEYTPGDAITNKEDIRNWAHFQERKIPDWWYYKGPYAGG